MSKKRDSDRMLFDLARDKGPDVIHLPYTAEFEAVCSQIKPAATTEDKRRFWEELLRQSEVDASPTETIVPSQATPSTVLRPETPVSPSPPPRISRAPEENGLLFDIHEPISDLQPWTVRPEPDLPPELSERRQKMLAEIAGGPLASKEQRIARILQKFPETRDSDTALCIRYWKMFQADVLERWLPLELEVLFELDRIETIGRMRRMIQNELRLFRGLEDTRRAREAMQAELHEYVAAHRDSLPEVRFYLDETGSENAYTGVAGVCIINWKQFEKHHAALEQWRSKQGWPETIHFSETGADKIERAVSLLQQLQSRRSGILFLGYSLASRGRTDRDQFNLFIQLVVDSLKHLRECGCLTENRSVRVIKEAQLGFDSVFLNKMTKQLDEVVALEFPGEVRVLPIEAVPKGRTVLLECADLIAGGMQRRALYKGRNPKDRLAEAVVNVTGFEDSTDSGTMFKYYAAGQ